jgi:DNA-binding transcriptional ArsR family regulator
LPSAQANRVAARSRATSAALFAALGDETRLRLITRLCDEGPMSITSLTAKTDVTRQAITKHLRLMHDAGILRETRQGRESIWHLEQGRLDDARKYLDEISNQWDGALDRLKAFVENEEP